MTAIGHAGICIGILATDGVLLGVEKKIASKLLEVTTSEKMYKVSAAAAARCVNLTHKMPLKRWFHCVTRCPLPPVPPDWRSRRLRDGRHHRRRQHSHRQSAPRRSALRAQVQPVFPPHPISSLTCHYLVHHSHCARYHEPAPVERLVRTICDKKQQYTQCAATSHSRRDTSHVKHTHTTSSFIITPPRRFGGLRPFGVSFLIAGWDEHFGFQLYRPPRP